MIEPQMRETEGLPHFGPKPEKKARNQKRAAGGSGAGSSEAQEITGSAGDHRRLVRRNNVASPPLLCNRKLTV